MDSPLTGALRALRPLRAALVGAPAVAGWRWAGGDPTDPGQATPLAAGAWALALAAFAWNDRADLRRGIAGLHPRAAVRALRPASDGWLLWLGGAAALAGVVCWTALGPIPGCLGVGVAACGWIYSDPAYFGKGRPRAAGVLHLFGGAANAGAGAWVGGASPLTAAIWAGSCGALFLAAHRVHLAADRDADRRAGVSTAATATTPADAVKAARDGLAWVAAGLVVAGLSLGDGRGAGLAAMGLAVALYVGLAAPRGDVDAGRWRRFQRGCRIAVAAGAAAAVGLAMAVPGGTAP